MDPAIEHTDELRQLCPGRFTKVSLHNQAGEIEARLSEGGNWELRIRRDEEPTWRMACSGDLDGGAFTAEPVGPAPGEEASRLGPLEIDPAARTASVNGTDVVLAKKEFAPAARSSPPRPTASSASRSCCGRSGAWRARRRAAPSTATRAGCGASCAPPAPRRWSSTAGASATGSGTAPTCRPSRR